MTREEALNRLSLPASAAAREIEAALDREVRDVESQRSLAPTAQLRAKYEQQLQELRQCREVLLGGAPAVGSLSLTQLGDLPQAAPGYTQDSGGEVAGARVTLEVGSVLAGRYEIRERIGAGGMGAVFRAFDQNRQSEIAIKVLLPGLLNRDSARERFLQEARLSSELSHPAIVNVFDVQRDGDFHFLTMELLKGRTLREEMEELARDRRPFPIARAVEVVTQVCEALEYAHKRTVHRDVKPENVFLCQDGTVKLMDFGIARVMSTSQLTMTGAAMGTAYYMAPEQLKGAKEVDGRADQYSVGVMLYELLTGDVPAGRVKAVVALRKEVGQELSDVIDRALEPDPGQRFPDVSALRKALSSGPTSSTASSKRGAEPRKPRAATPAANAASGGPRRLLVPMVGGAVALIVVLFALRGTIAESLNKARFDSGAVAKSEQSFQAANSKWEVQRGKLEQLGSALPEALDQRAKDLAAAVERAQAARAAWDSAVGVEAFGKATQLAEALARDAEAHVQRATADAREALTQAMSAADVQLKSLESRLADVSRWLDARTRDIERLSGEERRNNLLPADVKQLARRRAEVEVHERFLKQEIQSRFVGSPQVTEARTRLALADQLLRERDARPSSLSQVAKDLESSAKVLSEFAAALVSHEALVTSLVDYDEAQRGLREEAKKVNWRGLGIDEGLLFEAAAAKENEAHDRIKEGVYAQAVDAVRGGAGILVAVKASLEDVVGAVRARESYESARAEATEAGAKVSATVAGLDTARSQACASLRSGDVAQWRHGLNALVECWSAGKHDVDKDGALAAWSGARGEWVALMNQETPTGRQAAERRSEFERLSQTLEGADGPASAERIQSLLDARQKLVSWREGFDTRGPQLKSSNPSETEVGVGAATRFELRFDEPVAKASVAGYALSANDRVASGTWTPKGDPGPVTWTAEDRWGNRSQGTLPGVTVALPWYEVIRADPDPSVVTDAAVRRRMEATGLPWKVKDRKSGLVMVLVPPGEFTMGSPPGEEGRSDDERQHRVRLTKAFYLGETEVSQAEWQRLMGDSPSRFKGNDLPVENVSWDRVREYLAKSPGLRLPTEAEWEYACRAGTTTPFSFGSTISTSQANYDGNYTYGSGRKGEYREKTVSVRSFAANPWGLYQMHGNVWEWCVDLYGEYPSGAVTDPIGVSGASRVLRGGSWYFNPEVLPRVVPRHRRAVVRFRLRRFSCREDSLTFLFFLFPLPFRGDVLLPGAASATRARRAEGPASTIGGVGELAANKDRSLGRPPERSLYRPRSSPTRGRDTARPRYIVLQHRAAAAAPPRVSADTDEPRYHTRVRPAVTARHPPRTLTAVR